MPNSTTRAARKKPAKPYPDFPLFAHATGRWAKKIKGRLHYFGPWDNPTAALEKYLDQKDDLHAGRTPRAGGDGLTVRELLNQFLTAKRRAADAKTITPRTFRDYHWTCKRVFDTFGPKRLVTDLAADDFSRLHDVMAKTLSPVSRKTEIQKTRAIFNFAYNNDLIDRPIRFGSEFKAPGKKILKRERQKNRQENGARMFTAQQIRDILAATSPQLRAMFLLGINCGFGNSDVATLPKSALDLEGGWIDHPRPKTGEERRVPIWPETVQALRESLAVRPEPRDPGDSELAFLTHRGCPWVRLVGKSWTDAVTVMTRETLTKLGMKRRGLSFYALRHTFETVAGSSRDQIATNAIMGHSDGSMAAEYREGVDDDRLRAVVDHVHDWLFGKGGQTDG
jgi:integrase